MAIERLNQGTPTVASSVPFYDAANGRDARCSITELAALVLANQVVGAAGGLEFGHCQISHPGRQQSSFLALGSKAGPR